MLQEGEAFKVCLIGNTLSVFARRLGTAKEIAPKWNCAGGMLDKVLGNHTRAKVSVRTGTRSRCGTCSVSRKSQYYSRTGECRR